MAALASVPVPHAIQNIIAGSIGGASASPPRWAAS